MKANRIIFSILAASLSAVALSARDSGDRKLTLEDVYVRPAFTSGKRAPVINWTTGSSYDTFESASRRLPDAASAVDENQPTAVSGGTSAPVAVNGRDLVSTDMRTGKKTVLVRAEQLVPEGSDKAIAIEDYQWSADRTKLLIFTNSRRVWRRNTRGDYWVLNLRNNELRQLGKGFEGSRLMFAKLSPDGSKAAYVYYNNIYVEDLADGKIVQLTKDGDDVIVNGTFDWVYEEELGCRDGFRWSPDGRRIAFWRSDTEGTGVFNIINNIDSVYSFTLPFPYPKAGTVNSAVKVGVVDVADGATRWFDLPGDPRDNYIARMDFVPGSGAGTVMIQQLNRLQNTNTVWYGDAVSMELDNFLTDRDDAFLDIHDNIVWMDNNRYFTWTSEKDGWLHLYRMSRDGKSETLITKGPFDVMRILRIDLRGGYVYYMASPDNATESYLYRSRLDGKGRDERVTPAGYAGTHSYSISEDCRYAVHSFSNASTPVMSELITLPDHKTVEVYTDGSDVKAQFDAWGFNYREYFKVDLGYVELDAWMLKPRDFDPDKKYPVIFNVYGEPASSTVTNSWTSDLYNRVLNDCGYIVMSVDPRGTHNYRGREWRKCIYGKVGDVAIEDHALAVREIERMFSFVDSGRIGVWGWSGGGSSTALLMFKHPEIYSTGIAVAGVYSHNLYDTIYQERYQGLPQTNPEGYRNGSAINFASGLQGNLFLIHGTGDDNVHYQSCEMLANELVRQNKMFSMMAYPMRTHGISERSNTTYHLYQTMLKYWLENLPAGARDVTPSEKAAGKLLDPADFETEIDGKKVGLYTITNGTVSAQVTNYGGYIVGIYTPDRDGNYDNVVGHNDNIQQYLGFSMNPCGAALGRYANRIGNAEFTLDGVRYQVTRNNGQHMLHGGSKGFDHSVFDVVSVSEDSVVMSIDLEDGQDGFPGNMKTYLTFSVTSDNGVSIDFKAASDMPTVCSLSHHAYFNLNGFAEPQILDHVLTVDADSITETDAGLIPTGRFLPVDGTVYDLRKPVRLGDRQVAPQPMPMGFGGPRGGNPAARPQPQPVPEGMVRSYDNNFCLNHSVPGALEPVATLYSPESGRFMEVLNNHPGLQLFTGNRSGIAMESQMFPDSPNHPEFPSTVLRPGQIYSHTVVYRFSVK